MSEKSIVKSSKENLTYLGDPNCMTITTGTINAKDILNKK